MKIQIDLKSALAGLMLGVIVTLATGAGISSTPVGKFQIAVGVPGAVILDTQTGEAWGVANTAPNSLDFKREIFFNTK